MCRCGLPDDGLLSHVETWRRTNQQLVLKSNKLVLNFVSIVQFAGSIAQSKQMVVLTGDQLLYGDVSIIEVL